MLHAKFRADPIKNVAVHKEQKTDIQTDRHIRFLPRDAMLARRAVWYMLSSSVRLSVRPSHAGIVGLPKRINVGSRKQRHAIIAHGL